MKTLKTNFKGLEIFESQNIFDNRGYFREVFIKKKTKNYSVNIFIKFKEKINK